MTDVSTATHLITDLMAVRLRIDQLGMWMVRAYPRVRSRSKLGRWSWYVRPASGENFRLRV